MITSNGKPLFNNDGIPIDGDAGVRGASGLVLSVLFVGLSYLYSRILFTIEEIKSSQHTSAITSDHD
jgi:hypothetical protein